MLQKYKQLLIFGFLNISETGFQDSFFVCMVHQMHFPLTSWSHPLFTNLFSESYLPKVIEFFISSLTAQWPSAAEVTLKIWAAA